jgi:hypothetical protein
MPLRFVSYRSSAGGRLFLRGRLSPSRQHAFCLHHLWRVATDLRALFGVNIIGMIIANVFNKSMVVHLDRDKILRLGAGGASIAGATLAILSVDDPANLVWLACLVFYSRQ